MDLDLSIHKKQVFLISKYFGKKTSGRAKKIKKNGKPSQINTLFEAIVVCELSVDTRIIFGNPTATLPLPSYTH